MRNTVLALVLIAAPFSGLQAQAMPLSEFLAKADALEKKGPLALFSKDTKVLKAQMQNSFHSIEADERAARKAGRKPATCLPAKAGLGSNEIMRHFRGIPPAQRGMSVKAAFYNMMAKRYPCPG
jgi:hypothetical protein